MYRCLKCKSLITEFIEGKVMCPHCGYRILIKLRPEVVKRVQAR
ncbi:MAG: DNA-directed RNA polymerase subunit P [Candidatus Aenigmarchaeota archaeon]|nr:DNA-directed RNA polymerase subunit P [Candidatus Aenigmarchaeota archaeon]MCX8190886.1 DNA-directed RNA polymerase subunit P [Candidatus Aenigmarchaeota archaeon]MDW8159889.1 DNA-directed RNA polymerase subunit P [Candidatus Aenigmarchaeota archaeon]